MTAIAIAIIGLDQFTKHWVNARIRLHESRELIENFFHFTHVRNSGAAWGIFRQFPIALAILGGLALAILIVFGPFFQGKMRWTRWGWACLVGGIAGNLIDRLRQGSVTDFLDFQWNGHHWPAFNVADSAITAGVICYLIDAFLVGREERERDPAPQKQKI